MNKQIKFIIIDDHPVFREGLVQLIGQSEGFQIVAEVGSAQEAFDKIAEHKPDFATIDISLKGMDGIELIKHLKARYPELRMLVVSMHDESLYALRVLKAGAHGYIMKQEASKKVMTAINVVLSGKIYISEEMNQKMLRMMLHNEDSSSVSYIEKLSDRELQVFQMIGRGLGVSEIAESMTISIKTVETHRNKIKEKLMLKNAHELRQQAIDWIKNNDV